jgi:hypothetical protein
MIPLLFVAGAVAVLFFWPKPKAAGVTVAPPAADLFRVPPQVAVPPAPPAPPPAADTRAAIDSLLDVQRTLTDGGPVDPESAKALDRLWLDLFHARGTKS